MNPDMHHSESEKRIEASGQTFPADDQTAILALEPGKRPLGLVARDLLFDRPSPRLAAFPDAFGDLRANPACAEASAEVFGIITLIRGQYLEAFARSALLTCADVEAIQQRDNLGPLVPVRGRDARG
jgi:hypothetical protein